MPVVTEAGVEIWMALAAPRFDDPDERHGHARIHLIHLSDGIWSDAGPAMPDGFSPGSREWSGSAVLDDATAPGHLVSCLMFQPGSGHSEAGPPALRSA